MNKNTQVETAQKSQATNKDKTPIGKVKTIKSAEERRKAREEQFRNFRINALKRRCKRMKMSDEEIEKYVKKLIEQMNAPNEYTIIVMLNKNDMKMMEEAVNNAGLKYTHRSPYDEKKLCGGYFAFVGTQETLAKIRGITPPKAKIHTYAKKMESVLTKQEKEVIKKPSNNNKAVAAKAKNERKKKNIRIHKDKKTGEVQHRKMSERKNRHSNKTKVYTGKRAWKKARTTEACIKLSELIVKRKATTVQLNTKKSSTGSKKASTNLKKAA